MQTVLADIMDVSSSTRSFKKEDYHLCFSIHKAISYSIMQRSVDGHIHSLIPSIFIVQWCGTIGSVVGPCV